MYDKVGFVAEVTEGFCQKAEVAVPEKLVRANGEVGVEKDFQAGSGVILVTKRAQSKLLLIKKAYEPELLMSPATLLNPSWNRNKCIIIIRRPRKRSEFNNFKEKINHLSKNGNRCIENALIDLIIPD